MHERVVKTTESNIPMYSFYYLHKLGSVIVPLPLQYTCALLGYEAKVE